MAFTLLNSYEGVGSDTALDVTLADAACTNVVDTAQFAHGAKSKKLITAAGSLRAYDAWTNPGQLPAALSSGLFFRIYFQMSAVGSVQVPLVRPIDQGGALCFLLAVTTGSKLILTDALGVTLATSTTTIVANTWYRIEGNITGFTTAANRNATIRLYSSMDSNTITETLSAVNAQFFNTGGTAVVDWRWGMGAFTSSSPTLWIDDIALTDVAFLGPALVPITGTTETATATDVNSGIRLPTSDAVAASDPTPSMAVTATATEALVGTDISGLAAPQAAFDGFVLTEVSNVASRVIVPIGEGPMTICSIMDEVLDVVHGYVRGQESRTHLLGTISDSDLTLTVADSTLVSSGLMEVDDELMYVSAVNPNNGLVTIEPWGRAQSQTQAVQHLVGARVTNNPIFPRQRVRNVVWGVLREMFPDIYAVGEAFLDVNPAKTNYPMPTDCFHILGVQWHLPGPSGMWAEANRWRQSKRAGGPLELELLSRVWPGAGRVRVEYAKNSPTQFGACDDLADYGYDFQVRDVIVLGSAARLMAYTDTARVLTESVVSHGRDEMVPAGSATAVSRFLYTLFKQRVSDERNQQLMRHPIQVHMTR